MSRNNFWKLAVSLVICHSAGFAGSLFTVPAIDSWYVFLNKPSFSPPNWIFSPVWLTLYTLMGIALYLVWTSHVPGSWKNKTMWFFVAHLFINSSWSVIFFGFHNITLAFGIIIVLTAMIIISIKLFYRINPAAGRILFPYLIWVSFAVILNYCLMVLN